MKIRLNSIMVVAGFSFFSFPIVSCKKQESKSGAIKPSSGGAEITKSLSVPITDGSTASLNEKVHDDSITTFKYATLPRTLGRSISPEIEKRLELEGQLIPELQNIPIQGARPIAIDLHSSVKSIVYIKNHVLVSLGYLFQVPISQDSKTLEGTLLNEYSLQGNEYREAIGSEFSTVKITVQKYVNQTDLNLHAVSYTHGLSRTLVFYDSSVVDYQTMLPSTPEAMGKASIDKMKAEVERMKALIEQAKAAQKRQP